MEYVTYDQQGNLTGGYSQDLHPEHEHAYIAVSAEQRREWFKYQANKNRDGLIDALPVPISNDVFNAPILAQLEVIDAKSIRPLREGDIVRVAALEARAAALRAQLRKS